MDAETAFKAKYEKQPTMGSAQWFDFYAGYHARDAEIEGLKAGVREIMDIAVKYRYAGISSICDLLLKGRY